MRPMSMEEVEKTRKDILGIIEDRSLTHEQKVANLSAAAVSMMDVLDVPEGLQELLRPADEGDQCICDLFEGNAPVRPRYIIPDYAKFFRQGSSFLRLDPPKDFFEALNDLLIIYRHVPSVTNYPVYVGQLDELLDPFLTDDIDDATAEKFLRMFFLNVDRTVLDSFSHANIGPRDTRAGRLILKVEGELKDAVPNLTMKYDPDVTPDDFAALCAATALKAAKPSFANDKMFRSELGDNYVIASCYNGLLLGGGSYTLCRLILGNIAKRAKDTDDFLKNVLPYVCDMQARYMDARIRFEVEESGFFESNFLAKEGLIYRDRFTAMFGLVGLAEAVNLLMEKEGKPYRYGRDPEATELGVKIMDVIDQFNKNHVNPYCEATDGHFLLHAQVGIATDINRTPGTRIPIGQEPDLADHLRFLSHFHHYFPSGTGDIFPVDVTVHRNPEYIVDIVKGAFRENLRYLSFYESTGDVFRVTGYLAKRSEIQKYEKGEAVMHDTTQLAAGASELGHAQERRILG